MEKMVVEIKKRNRDYGIITWPYSLDYEAKTLFSLKGHITIKIGDKMLQNRKISYKFRRFSVGKKRIESYFPTDRIAIIKEDSYYRLEPEK